MQVGDVLYGYCHGTFGDSWGEKVVEHIGRVRGKYYVVVSERGWYRGADDDDDDPIMFHLYRGDPDSLIEYTTKPPDEYED